MKVQVEDVSPIEKRLAIEVEPALVEKELSQAYAQLSHQVKIPGFRPGKVPRRILEQRYKSEIEADVVKRVQLMGFVDAVRQAQVSAVGDPQFSGGTLEAQKPFAYTAKVEVKPVVQPRDYKGLTLKKLDVAVTDAQVEEQLERLRANRTEVVAVQGRDAAQKGDLVIIDFDATVAGKPFPGNTGRGVTVEVADGQLIEGNLPQLEGAKVGATVEVDYTFPADYRVEEVRGQVARFVVTVKELKEKKAPALDDDFAKAMGFETMGAFRARVRADLERAAKGRSENDEREDVFKKLVEKNAFDVPSALVNRGIDMMLESALSSMARSGMDPSMLKLDWGSLRQELKPRSELEVRGQLILEAIVKAERLSASDADLDDKLKAMAGENAAMLPMLQQQYRVGEARDALRARVLEEKAIALVKQHAKFE